MQVLDKNERGNFNSTSILVLHLKNKVIFILIIFKPFFKDGLHCKMFFKTDLYELTLYSPTQQGKKYFNNTCFIC